MHENMYEKTFASAETEKGTKIRHVEKRPLKPDEEQKNGTKSLEE